MYDEVLRCMQAVALMLPCIGCFLDAPFGKFGLPSAWNVNGNVGWMLMESVAPLAVCVSFYGQVQAVIHAWARIMLWLFVAHYVNRAWIQPWMNPPRTPLHISVVLSAMAFNAANGYLIGTWLARGGPIQHVSAWIYVGLMAFALGFVGNVYHDTLLRRLRTSPPRTKEELLRTPSSTYRVPHGGLFHWISYPNYTCECTYMCA